MSRPSPHGCFAPHIHVLYREVPFILNITACPEERYRMASATLSKHQSVSRQRIAANTTLSKRGFYTYIKPSYFRCRAILTQAAPTHPYTRGIPFTLNIKAPLSKLPCSLGFPIEAVFLH